MGLTTFSGPVASQNGFIENSFTTAERDEIVDPVAGLLIYNTTTNTYEVYNGTSWQAAFGGGGGGGTYTVNVDYSYASFMSFAGNGISIRDAVPALGSALSGLTIGSTFTMISDVGDSYTFTVTSVFISSPGVTLINYDGAGTPSPSLSGFVSMNTIVIS